MSQKTLTLLERKRLQWDKEKEELIGLCSPWGCPPSLKLSTSCTSLTEGMKSLSTNLTKNGQSIVNKRSSNPTIIPSSYLHDLGLTGSQSECHLPPIGLDKQKGQESDGFREFKNTKGKDAETPHWFSRKRSLPSCILTTTGEVCSQSRNFGQEEILLGNNNNFHHANGRDMDTDEKHQQRHYRHFDKWPLQHHQEEDPHTSGYQSENNQANSSEGSGDSRNGTGDSGKDPQLLRRFFSSNTNKEPPLGSLKLNDDRTPRDAYVYTSEVDYFNQNLNGWTKPGSYLYSKRNEMDHYEVEQLESRYMTKSLEAESLEQKTWSYVNSRIHIPPPAMRSSFTNSIEAPDRDAYKDIKKQEHQKWLRDLEQQRDEQRLRKLMEKDEKAGRAKWGDRGVVVGHLWEPASVPDARLPRRAEGEGNFSGSGANDGSDVPPPRWSESQFGNIFDHSPRQTENGVISGITRDHAEAYEVSERDQKMQKAMQHQEALRKQMEERQQKLKETQERRMEEERAEETKILTDRLEQLRKLEFEQRQQLIRQQEAETQQNGPETMENTLESKRRFSRGDDEMRVFQKQQEIENAYLMRKNLTTSFTLPSINPLESPVAASPHRQRSISPFEEYEATIVRERAQSDALTPASHVTSATLQGVLPITQEFGTQTELSEESANEVHVQHKGEKEPRKLTKSTQETTDAENNLKKISKRERPKWGIPPPTKQYLKQSEKDPHYQVRCQRRRDRQKRRENQLKFVKQSAARGDDKREEESEDSQSQKEAKTSTSKAKSNLKSKQKSIANGYTATKKERFVTVDHFATENVEAINAENEHARGDFDEVNNTRPKTKKNSTPLHGDMKEAKEKRANREHRRMSQSNPSIQTEGKPEELAESMSGVEFRKTDSPPVPAVMNRMNQSMQAGKLFNLPSFPDDDDENSNFFGRTPMDTNFKERTSPLPRLSPKLSLRNPAERRSSSEDSAEAEKDLVSESIGPPKLSPATLVIESSADYFTHPTYFGAHSSRSSIKSPQTPSYYSNLTPLASPPAPLKQLMYGIQNFGNYLPMTPGSQLFPERDSEVFSSELHNSHPNRTIEFTIKFPAEYYRQNFQGIDLQSNNNGNDVEEYRDPLVEERKKSTMEWIRSNSNSSRGSSTRDHLATMKKGIRHQQEEWGMVPSDSEIGASLYGSSFYPSSGRSSSSN